MKKIDALTSLEGRKLLRKLFKDLRFGRQMSGIATLLVTWRICVQNKEISKYAREDINILHHLGFVSGTWLWMEEIVNRFYYSSFNSFVYFGAAVLLVLIGIRRFSDIVNDDIVIMGIIFEALMLLFLFIVMLFSPHDELPEDDEESEENELLMEIGEIGRDFASLEIRLEELGNSFSEMIANQKELIGEISKIADNTAQAVAPNPKLLDSMNKTGEKLNQFSETVKELNKSAEIIRKEQIELAVRKEVEKIFSKKIDRHEG